MLMAQRQPYGSHGNGCSGSGTQRHETGGFLLGHGPYYSPERDGNYENEPMITSFAYINREIYTARRFTTGDASNVQPGLGINPPDKPNLATTPEPLENDNSYSRSILPDGVANNYDPLGGTFQQNIHRRSQEEIISDVMRPECQPRRQPYSDSIVPYVSNTDWIPNEPSERMSSSFDSAWSPQYTASTTVCANCRKYSRIDGDQIHQPNQGDVGSNTNWRVQEVKDSFFGPSEQNFQSTGRTPTEEARHDTPYIQDLSVPGLEQPTGLNVRNPNATDALGNPVTVRVDKECTKKGLTKKRKRKPRTAKPRKQRTLSEVGKAHAKEVRKWGACEDCRRKKIQARHPTMTNLGSTRL